jgi:hypothetical protein
MEAMIATVPKYCCAGFKALLNQMGERGFSVVIAKRFDGTLKAYLQHRICSATDEAAYVQGVKASPIRAKVDSSIVSQIAITFCPYCGTNLDEWIVSQRDCLGELLERSRVLVILANTL